VGLPSLVVAVRSRARALLQVVVLDKLDYCASLKNLDAVRECPNFKARPRHLRSSAAALDRRLACAHFIPLLCTPSARLVQFVKGDVTSSDFLIYLLREERIDTILHFAAQARARTRARTLVRPPGSTWSHFPATPRRRTWTAASATASRSR
jgi:hypothetical protein